MPSKSGGSYDLAVIGAGIVGLAHAYLAARNGLRVLVLERSTHARGASVRNFGLIWPIGQSADNYPLALRSRHIWTEVLEASGISHQPTGSLHLAYRADERAVAEEFARLGSEMGYRCEWLDKESTLHKTAAVRSDALLGALWSSTEMTVDPREVLRVLPVFLAKKYSVDFHFGAPVTSLELPRIRAGSTIFLARNAIVCPGSDLRALYSESLSEAGLILCKLQMLRTVPQTRNWRLGPALAGGLTLRFYPSFEICRSLPVLRERIARETPESDRWGIHTMVSMGGDGTLALGDSHEYGADPSPFLQNNIEQLILGHIGNYLAAPNLTISERWYGVYAKHPTELYSHITPQNNLSVITGLGGAGMTLSLGVAERVLGTLA